MFDIEEKMEAIPDPKTKKLFGEVYSSYQHGNYRSAVVMLWSVVIADMIFKLKFLDNTYRNKKAQGILKDIDNKQKEHPERPEWEKTLLKKAYEELKFITSNEKINLEYLHTQRNLSAHPVLTDDNLLLAPNKDTTRSLIRNAMEAILLKTPLLHSELVNSVVEDLASNRERLGSYENVKPYIRNRYFPNMSEEGAKKIFKALWRFIFDPRNPKEQDNRQINFFALLTFSEKYKDLYASEIQNSAACYQASSQSIDLMIRYLIYYPQMYQPLDGAVKTLITATASKTINQYIMCDFLSMNLEDHYNKVLLKMDTDTLDLSSEDIRTCYNKAKGKHILNKFFEICIKEYSKSINFDCADANYNNFISPFLDDYKLDDILLLMKKTFDKSQVCNRGRAVGDHMCVLKYFNKLGGSPEYISKWKHWNDLYLKGREVVSD